jgi:hypothetical protein
VITETIPQHANEPEKGNASERHQVDRERYGTRSLSKPLAFLKREPEQNAAAAEGW